MTLTSKRTSRFVDRTTRQSHFYPPAPFAIKLRRPHTELAVILVRGELDLLTAPALSEVVDSRLRSDLKRVVVDLSQLDFVGAAGLSVLTHADLVAAHSDTEFCIVVGKNRTVIRALTVARLDRILPIVTSPSDFL